MHRSGGLSGGGKRKKDKEEEEECVGERERDRVRHFLEGQVLSNSTS